MVDGVMHLITIQPESVADTLASGQDVTWEAQKTLQSALNKPYYDLFRGRVKAIRPHYTDSGLWWAWHTLAGTRVPERLDDFKELCISTNMMKIAAYFSPAIALLLHVPDDEILLSDYFLWDHLMTMNTPPAYTDQEEKKWINEAGCFWPPADHEIDPITETFVPKIPPAQLQIMARTADRFFDLRPDLFAGHSELKGKVGHTIQATFEHLRHRYVSEMKKMW